MAGVETTPTEISDHSQNLKNNFRE